MRKKIIAGNWKMNKGPREAVDFLDKLVFEIKDDRRLIICPPYVSLMPMMDRLPQGLELAAQNIHQEASGAYTGEISLEMVKELGLSISLVGHSERRSYYNETDALVNKKLKRAFEASMEVILCLGESLETRKKGEEKALVRSQLEGALEGLKEEELRGLIVAYEPVWAIGTGLSASSQDAQDMAAFIRRVLAEIYSEELAEKTPILYGGSVSPANIEELMAREDVDGVLVGGASLDPESFASLAGY